MGCQPSKPMITVEATRPAGAVDERTRGWVRIGQRRRMVEGPPGPLVLPFTLTDGRRSGLTDDVLHGPRFDRPFRGVRAAAGYGRDVASRCRAAALALAPEAAFSHATAAALLGLPRVGRPDRDPLDVTVPRGLSVPTATTVRGHDALWQDGDVVVWQGLRVTSPERTLCDLSARLTRRELLILADAILSGNVRRPELATKDQLHQRVEEWSGRRGARLLRDVLSLACDRVDSPMETVLRLLIIDAGLPRPAVNEPVADGNGVILHRPDLSWPPWQVAVEYDGVHHFAAPADRAVWRRRQDVARVELMQDLGWIVRVMTKDDVLHRPASAVARITRALRERGAPV